MRFLFPLKCIAAIVAAVCFEPATEPVTKFDPFSLGSPKADPFASLPWALGGPGMTVTQTPPTPVPPKPIPKPVLPSITSTKKDIPPTDGKVRVSIATSPKLTDQALWMWSVTPEANITVVTETGNSFVFDVAMTPEVEYSIKWTAKEPSSKQIVKRATVKAGHGPQPPPVPPGPTPVPPGPTPVPPTPTAGMIDLPGFHVLVKYVASATDRPDDEYRILFSESPTSARQYLKLACQTVSDGQGWRYYPEEALGVAVPWKAPYDRAKSLPWATISKNGKGWEGSIAGMTPEAFVAKCKEIEALP